MSRVRSLFFASLLAVAAGTAAHAEGFRGDARVDVRVGPPRGAYVHALPRDSVHLAWRGGHYWTQRGVWYRPSRGRFVVIAPPVGIIVPVLPPDYSLRWYGGAPYYFANGTYYASAPGQGYAVVDAPPGADLAPDAPGVQPPSSDPYGSSAPYAPAPPTAPAAPAAPVAPVAPVAPTPSSRVTRTGEPIVYPRSGQSPDQTQRDRGECAQWSTQQAVGSDGRDVYVRAFDACMDGRGYSVR